MLLSCNKKSSSRTLEALTAPIQPYFFLRGTGLEPLIQLSCGLVSFNQDWDRALCLAVLR